MPPLADLQHRMVRALLDADIRGLPPLAPTAIPAEAAFGVHRNTVLSVLAKALRLTFPTVNTLVGEAFFDQAAEAYGIDHPPTQARLAVYGEAFPAFLEGYDLASGLVYLGDVARLDLAIDWTLIAPDACVRRHVVIDEAVCLALPISLTVLSLSYPADSIRAALDTGDDQTLASIDLAPQPRFVAVWRVGREAAVLALGQVAGLFLAAGLDGATADEALAAAFAAAAPQDALRAIQAEVFAARFAQITPIRLEDTTS
jgi:hypothetical protein